MHDLMALIAVNYFCRNIMINYYEFEIIYDSAARKNKQYVKMIKKLGLFSISLNCVSMRVIF